MPKVLITGGTGFVGHWMKHTAPAEMELVCIGRAEYNLWYWHKVKWDYIVHLAPIDPAKVLECAGNHTRVLYASSGIIYHPENDTQYRRDKMAWEQACLDSGAEVVIARLFTFYGDKLDGNKAYTAFSQAAKCGTPLEIWGDGNTVRSYMHGSEMGCWLWAILLKGKRGEAYDVGSDDPITMAELANNLVDKYQSESLIIRKYNKEPMPYYMPKNTAKTRKLLTV